MPDEMLGKQSLVWQKYRWSTLTSRSSADTLKTIRDFSCSEFSNNCYVVSRILIENVLEEYLEKLLKFEIWDLARCLPWLRHDRACTQARWSNCQHKSCL